MTTESTREPEPARIGTSHEPPPAMMKTGQDPLEFLKPNSEQHAFVLDYLVKRLETSERAMSAFHPRWRVNEAKYQAYIDLNDYEKILENMNKQSKTPQVISIQVPYSFATVTTINTYMLQTFCGRKPLMQVSAMNPDHTRNAKNMEHVIQYNHEHSKTVRHFNRFSQDQQVYGVGVFMDRWCNKREKRTQTAQYSNFSLMGLLSKTGYQKQRADKLVYSGNEVATVDPFMFFPDPRVPMSEVNRRGEFCFWRSYEGKHMLLREQANGYYKWVDWAAAKLPHDKWAGGSGDSQASPQERGRGSSWASGLWTLPLSRTTSSLTRGP